MKRALKIFGYIALTGIVLATVGFAGIYIWATKDLPNINNLSDYRPALATTVLARNGKTIGLLYNEKRFLLTLDQMPKHLPLAFLAAEDSAFYSHPGINPIAIARAFWVNFQTGRTTQGGSTITQQIIKRLVLTPERSYERKIKEAILAYRLENSLSKDEILTIYLNETFFGANSYGVEAAARTFFGKNARDLTIAESALIAGLPKAPSTTNPYRNPKAARNRQLYVLGRLKELLWITDAEYDAAVNQPLVYTSMPESMGWEASWYLEEVRRQLIEMLSEENAKKLGIELPVYGEQAVYQLGLTVRTAMEPHAQFAADRALRKGLEATSRRHGWFGPLEKIPADRLTDAIKNTPFNPEQLANNNWAKATVTEVTAKSALVRLGEFHGVIPVANMSWARTPNIKVAAAHAAPVKDARKVLEPGDVIWVSLNNPVDPKTKAPLPYNPANITPDSVIELKLEQYPSVQGALVSLEPATGDVIAMVGGYSFGANQFIRATQAKRQPGSAFKAFVYSAALDAGYTPATIVQDAPVVLIDQYTNDMWRPSNFEDNFRGPMLLRTAMALSRNLVTVRLAQDIGMGAVVERAKALGIEADLPELLAISLGAAEVSPLNITEAYGVFANGGLLNKARFIIGITDSKDNVVYQHELDTKEVISPQNAYLMSALLKEVVTSGTGSKAKVLERPVGGKTGTSNEERDAWFMGITPYVATGVFVGYDQVRSMGRFETGGNVATPIFVDYARTVFQAYPPDDFYMPEGISVVTVDKSTGQKVPPESENSVTLPFYLGTEPGSGSAVEQQRETVRRGEDLLKQLF